jgi:hypothetical protein
MKVQNGIGVCWFFILIITLLLGGYSFAQEEEEEEEPMVGERPSLQASELSSAFRFDGYLYESVWTNAADSISNLIVVEPEEGGEPEGRTVVKVFVDRFDILVAVRCYDDNPKGIVAFSKARDAELEEEDNITLGMLSSRRRITLPSFSILFWMPVPAITSRSIPVEPVLTDW